MKIAKVKQPRTNNNHKSTQVKTKHKVTHKHKPTAKPVSFTATTTTSYHQPTIRHFSKSRVVVNDDEHTPTGACSMVYGDCLNTDEQLGSELKTKLNTNNTNNHHHTSTMMNDQHHQHSTTHKQQPPPKQCPESKTTSSPLSSTTTTSSTTQGIPT
eukprot:UN04033